jgi:hypothetical protein
LHGVSRGAREEVVRLWLTEGIPFAFRLCPIVYEEMRSWLASRLDVGAKEITLVGSARIGFSLAGAIFGRPFDHQSDLDLCVVSEPRFVALAETFSRWTKDYTENQVLPSSARQKRFWDQNVEFGRRNLSIGFVDANKIPTLDRYPLVQRIQQTMWALTKKLQVTHDAPAPSRASTRIYKTWPALINRVSFNLQTTLAR